MGAIAVLLEGRALPPLAPLPALGRSSSSQARFQRCRSLADLEQVLQTQLTEAILLDPRNATEGDLEHLRSRYPGIPIAIIGRLRAEDAGLVLRWYELGVALVLVEGIDDVIAGELLIRQTVSQRRRTALAEFPRLLGLTEQLQLLAWERLGESVAPPPGMADLARALGVSREHLSRQFAAGGAPTLKQVADLVRVITALTLLQNPAYDTAAVVRLLGFASASHLHTVVRRVTGTGLPEAQGFTPRDVLRRFLRTQSRRRRSAMSRVPSGERRATA